ILVVLHARQVDRLAVGAHAHDRHPQSPGLHEQRARVPVEVVGLPLVDRAPDIGRGGRDRVQLLRLPLPLRDEEQRRVIRVPHVPDLPLGLETTRTLVLSNGGSHCITRSVRSDDCESDPVAAESRPAGRGERCRKLGPWPSGRQATARRPLPDSLLSLSSPFLPSRNGWLETSARTRPFASQISSTRANRLTGTMSENGLRIVRTRTYSPSGEGSMRSIMAGEPISRTRPFDTSIRASCPIV